MAWIIVGNLGAWPSDNSWAADRHSSRPARYVARRAAKAPVTAGSVEEHFRAVQFVTGLRVHATALAAGVLVQVSHLREHVSERGALGAPQHGGDGRHELGIARVARDGLDGGRRHG